MKNYTIVIFGGTGDLAKENSFLHYGKLQIKIRK
jgi:glucose-6-phosphate 1-dehydrogenase